MLGVAECGARRVAQIIDTNEIRRRFSPTFTWRLLLLVVVLLLLLLVLLLISLFVFLLLLLLIAIILLKHVNIRIIYVCVFIALIFFVVVRLFVCMLDVWIHVLCVVVFASSLLFLNCLRVCFFTYCLFVCLRACLFGWLVGCLCWVSVQYSDHVRSEAPRGASRPPKRQQKQ